MMHPVSSDSPQQTPERSMRSRGFTLLELLIVIGIITILSVFTVMSVGSISRDVKVATGVNRVTTALATARAEAILVAFAARRAIERGTPLGYLEEQLRQRFGPAQQPAVTTVISVARDPVTIEALRQALDANASLILNPGTENWFDGLVTELRSLVVLHDANSPSPLPSARLARAQRMIDAGQVESALEEVSRLPGGPQATKWMAAARRYVAARQALDTLETAAIVGTIPANAAVSAAFPPSAPAPTPGAQSPQG